ncbi:MAG: B12-binding domain-containing radical SAM protein [Elusimicrobia bacterium]|nr:B12-binding domain-containing radical SAM protein [Elusimicrobiota bacterium]
MSVVKKINILLARMPVIVNTFPAIALPCLVAVLKQNGYSAKSDDVNISIRSFPNTNYVDGNFVSYETQKAFFEEHKSYFEGWAESVISSGVNVLGFSLWRTNENITRLTAEIVKQKKPEIKIIYGGPGAALYSPSDVLESKVVDVVVWGEGEETLLEVLEKFENNESLEYVKGISFLSKDGFVKNNPPRSEIEDLNALPFIDLSGIDIEKYPVKSIPLMFARGCSWRCKFCECFVTWKTYRTRTADNIFNEILLRLKEFKRERYYFQLYDCALNQDLKMLGELCAKIISLGLPKGTITFGGCAKIMSAMDFDFIKKLSLAGLDNWAFGVESGSDKVLKLMGKPYTAAKAEEVLKNGYELGIAQSYNIIVGFPGETEEDWDKTISFIERTSEYVNDVNFCYMMMSSSQVQERFKNNIAYNEGFDAKKWVSLDGTNTFEIRVKRMERLEERILKSTKLLKKDPMHYVKKLL